MQRIIELIKNNWWRGIVLAVATFIIQSHAIPYWVSQAGWSGVIWSVGAEILAWWFLSHINSWYWAGVGAALIVLSGPLVNTTMPLVIEARQEKQRAQVLQQQVNTLNKTITMYRQRAQHHRNQSSETKNYTDGRHGEQVKLAARAEAKVDESINKRQKLKQKLKRIDKSGLSFEEFVYIILHSGILIIAWLGSITSLTAIANGNRRKVDWKKISKNLEKDEKEDFHDEEMYGNTMETAGKSEEIAENSTESEKEDELENNLTKLRNKVKQRMEDERRTQRQWAFDHRINERDLSLLMRLEESERKPSNTQIKYMIDAVNGDR